jgi:cellulose synthase/poly-beta-1,6-N-acetylglucosamine synthase-like glycosyltransferase
MQGVDASDQLEQLLRHSSLSPEEEEALRAAVRRGTPLDRLLASSRANGSEEAYRALAGMNDLRYAAFPDCGAVDTRALLSDVAFWSRQFALPIRMAGGTLAVATALPLSLDRTQLASLCDGAPDEVLVCTRAAISGELQRSARHYLSDLAVNGLLRRTPEYSASIVATPAQKAVGGILLAGLALFLVPGPTLVVLNLLVMLMMLSVFMMRTALVWVGGADKDIRMVSPQAVANLTERDYPIYSILVPMYQEASVLPQLVAGLDGLDYPADKLDIKLLLESDDHETLATARSLPLDGRFDIIVVPAGQPRTKPKACNYALPLVRGELVVIFDAEDVPEPDQLKKVLVTFLKSDARLACVQCRLNYFNAEQNWLTRLFTLEYTLWFDFFLPALDALNLPIPLGGTSNHFRTALLRDTLAGWDPYNVTEDADLGLRMAVLGYRTCVIDSTTFEEATSQAGNWIRQRTRWIKGYMVTWLVHMRNPLRILRGAGWRGFVALHLFVGGVVVASIMTPVLWVVYLCWLLTGTDAFDAIFPTPLLVAGMFNLLAVNTLYLYLNLLACLRRGGHRLFIYSLTAPLYWAMQSYAGVRALWQFVSNPFYWEKTRHGINKAK